jgi:hypothetical protein
VNSTDHYHYNRININLPNTTNWQHAILTATSLVTQCNMVVIDDYNEWIGITIIEADGQPNVNVMRITEPFCGFQNYDEVIVMLNYYLDFNNSEIEATLSSLHTIEFVSPNNKAFVLHHLSYNMKILTGFYTYDQYRSKLNTRLNLPTICADAVGFLNSTPILYLISPLGDINVHNTINSKKCETHSVLMRIQNSFSPLMPLIATNVEFSKKIHIGDITNFEAMLVDANLHEVHLLSPMWVTFTVQEAPPDDKDKEDFWQYSYVRVPRPLPSPDQLFPLNPELLEALESEPTSFS